MARCQDRGKCTREVAKVYVTNEGVRQTLAKAILGQHGALHYGGSSQGGPLQAHLVDVGRLKEARLQDAESRDGTTAYFRQVDMCMVRDKWPTIYEEFALMARWEMKHMNVFGPANNNASSARMLAEQGWKNAVEGKGSAANIQRMKAYYEWRMPTVMERIRM